MAITLNAAVYSLYRHGGNRAEYIGAAHSDSDKDMLIVNSVAPKQTAASYGNRRTSVNLVDTITVATPGGESIQKDMKLELVGSIPVGATFADFEAMAAKQADLLGNSALLKQLFETGQVIQS
nr:MAG: hypothetical protein 2 [Leviviridae sp.]